MGRRKQAVKPKVSLIYSSSLDYQERLKKVMALLLRPIAEELSNKKEKPPSDSEGINGINGGSNGKDRKHE